MNNNDAIEKTIDAYFQGLYRGDVTLLRQAFAPTAVINGYSGDGWRIVAKAFHGEARP